MKKIIYFIIIVILIYIIWHQANLILIVGQEKLNKIELYKVFIEHSLGKVHQISWYNGRNYKIQSFDISIMITYEKPIFRDAVFFHPLSKDNINLFEYYQSILLKKPNIYKWKEIGNINICELYLGDKDYLYAETMEYNLDENYVKIFLVYTEDVKTLLKKENLWPILSNKDNLMLEIEKKTVRMTTGEISQRLNKFNELKDIFFSNYRIRPAFFVLYNNKDFQLLFGQEFKFVTYEDLFQYKQSDTLKFLEKNETKILNYYNSVIKEVA